MPADRNDVAGGAWLIADMALNIWALSLVKWIDGAYPAVQIVFLRALVGLVLIAPLVWHRRAIFANLPDLPLHLLRVALSVVTLTASFFAISRVPFALFTAIGFTRPLVTMVMTSLVLGERIGTRRWIAAGVALIGVVIAVDPSGGTALGLGLLALGVVVFSGSAAITATRRLRDAPALVLMTFYTAGLTVFTAPFAVLGWQPVAADHVVPLLLVGCFAQAAQLCFLRAHYFGGAGALSVLSYLSLVLSTLVGYAVFGEVPGAGFVLGAALVVGAAAWSGLSTSRGRPRA